MPYKISLAIPIYFGIVVMFLLASYARKRKSSYEDIFTASTKNIKNEYYAMQCKYELNERQAVRLIRIDYQ